MDANSPQSIDELPGSEIHQLHGGEIHQLDHQPIYEAPGSYPPVYEKEGTFVKRISLPVSTAAEEMKVLGRGGGYVKLEQR
jgi:hypothetical protein